MELHGSFARTGEGHGTDKAIAELTKAARINTDTVEIYQSLGNLFREKGEIDRAIKIHQNIVARDNIDDSARVDALMDLGIDYRKAGIFDQAIATFLQVIEQQPNRVDAHEHSDTGEPGDEAELLRTLVVLSDQPDRPGIEVVDRVVTQSSDSEYHCLTITVFFKNANGAQANAA